jgi:hypothetical protein
VSVEQLRDEFPEFAHTNEGLLAGKIADASAMLNAHAFGDVHDQAVKYMAAHLVSLSPGGQFARLDPNEEEDGARTLYERQYLALQRGVIGAMVV